MGQIMTNIDVERPRIFQQYLYIPIFNDNSDDR